MRSYITTHFACVRNAKIYLRKSDGIPYNSRGENIPTSYIRTRGECFFVILFLFKIVHKIHFSHSIYPSRDMCMHACVYTYRNNCLATQADRNLPLAIKRMKNKDKIFPTCILQRAAYIFIRCPARITGACAQVRARRI